MKLKRERKYIVIFGERIGVISAVTASLTFLFTLGAFYIEVVTAETTLAEFCGFVLLAGIPSYIVLLAGSSQNRYGNFSEVTISAKLIAPLILFVAFFGLLAIIFASIGW